MEELRKRKKIRLSNADYNRIGVYFLTICTSERKCILSNVVEKENTDIYKVELTRYGEVVDKKIREISDFYDNISIEHYVVMPNHVHLLLYVKKDENGPSGTPVPTTQNSVVSRFLSTLKRFCNKEIGENIWQYRSYDHIIRNSKDYEEHVKYIYENPTNWYYDELYPNN